MVLSGGKESHTRIIIVPRTWEGVSRKEVREAILYALK